LLTEVRRVRFVAARLVKQDIPATGVLAMHIGLIGGIGPAATDFYYRRLISAFAGKNTALELTIVHADTPTLLAHLARNDAKAQIAIYQRLTDRLVAAGAGCVVVTSIAGHFCIDGFKDVSPLPVVDMIAEVRAAIEARGLKRIEILGTRTVMETRFYGGVTSAEIVPPDGHDLDDVHDAYVAMAASGVATPAQRAVFTAVGQRLLQDRGAEAIMLGGTDLALVFDEKTADFPLVDCAGIHVEAVMRLAMG
jgi:aspartate racemase